MRKCGKSLTNSRNLRVSVLVDLMLVRWPLLELEPPLGAAKTRPLGLRPGSDAQNGTQFI